MKTTCKYYCLLLLGSFLCLQLASCKKYLDEKSNKALIVPTTLNDLQSLLDNDYTNNVGASGFGPASDDDYFMTPETYNAVYDNDRLVYTWRLKVYSGFPNDWANAYVPVFNANYCLEHITTIKKTVQNEHTWNNVYGGAHFFRGYHFLSLLWDFAKAYDAAASSTDPGIVLRLGADFNERSVRSSAAEGYRQVIADLQEAAAYLPDNPIHPMRPSKAAAFSALARAYLSMRLYDSSYKYASAALQIKHELLDYNGPGVDITASMPFQPFNKEIIFHTLLTIGFSTNLPSLGFTDTVLYNTYDHNDLRKTAFFTPSGNHQTFKGFYANRPAFFNGPTTAEMLLTRAECHARAARLTDAVNDLNTLLVNRYATGTFVPLVAGTQAQVLATVLKERRKELTTRGLRWMDIKRFNKEGAAITIKRVMNGETFELPPNDSRYALPIPDDIIRITGMPQN